MKYFIVLLAVLPLFLKVNGVEVPFPKESILNMKKNNILKYVISKYCIENNYDNKDTGREKFKLFLYSANRLEEAFYSYWYTFLHTINFALDTSLYCDEIESPDSFEKLLPDMIHCLDQQERRYLVKFWKLSREVISYFCKEEGNHFLLFLASEVGKNWRDEHQSQIEMCWNKLLSGYHPQPDKFRSMLLLDFVEHMVQCNTLQIFQSCIVSNLEENHLYKAGSELETLYESINDNGYCMNNSSETMSVDSRTTPQIFYTTSADIRTTGQRTETTEQRGLFQLENGSSDITPMESSFPGSTPRKNGFITIFCLSGALVIFHFFEKIL